MAIWDLKHANMKGYYKWKINQEKKTGNKLTRLLLLHRGELKMNSFDVVAECWRIKQKLCYYNKYHKYNYYLNRGCVKCVTVKMWRMRYTLLFCNSFTWARTNLYTIVSHVFVILTCLMSFFISRQVYCDNEWP